MIVRFSLLMVLAAILSFMLAMAFYECLLITLAEQFMQLGVMALLFAFTLLCLAGLIHGGRLLLEACCSYFSVQRRMERNVLFYINKHNHLNQFFQLKKDRLLYVSQQKRKCLFNQQEDNPKAL